MSKIQSSEDHLTLNADGASKDIKFQANGVEKASISSAGLFTATTIDATKLTGDLPAISGASLTGVGVDGIVSSANATAITINSSEQVNVGTSTNRGATSLTVESDTTTGNPMAVSNSRTTSGTDYSILFYRAASIVGSVQTSLSSTSFVTSSDYRLKENVTPMSGSIDRLKQLKPSRFNFIADADTIVDGFLAHEAQAIVPEAVTGEKDAMSAEDQEVPDYQGIDQSKLVPLLVGAIQELITRVEELEN
jgi:hypothetical protein